MESLPIIGDDPLRRFGHTVTLINDTKAVLFGGAVPTNEGNFDITNDTFMFSYENLSWRRIHPECDEAKPSPRAAHGAAVVERNQIVIFGGASGRKLGSSDGEMADDNLYLLRIKDPNTEDGRWLRVPIEGIAK